MSRAVQLSALNLNHLLALDVLLAEQNLRRAAERMGVTQSAMSHTLRALRQTLSDPLLVRVGNDMALTPFAEGIQEQLRRGMSALESVVSGRAAFDPESIADEFTVAMHDGTATALAAPLHRRLRAAAPRARLHVTTIDPEALGANLRSGAVDAAVVPPFIDVSGLESEVLAGTESELVVICRRDHPRVRKRLSLDAFCDIPHATVSLGGTESAGYLDELLSKLGRRRSLEVRVAYISALGEILESSDCLALVPRPAAEQFFCKRWDLRLSKAPLELPSIPFVLCWHARFAEDPPKRFLRDLLRAAALDAA